MKCLQCKITTEPRTELILIVSEHANVVIPIVVTFMEYEVLSFYF